MSSEADVIILNTCSVREKAVQKVYTRLGEIKQYKARRKDILVGVVGCMAQLEKDRILKRAPYREHPGGPAKRARYGSTCRTRRKLPGPIVDMRTDEAPSPLQTPISCAAVPGAQA